VVSWSLTLRRTYRPWWSLWLVVRWHELRLTRDGTGEDVLASAADLKAQFPKWDFDLRRVE
jgi:hypothetical protein